jgi:hypothetical protein
MRHNTYMNFTSRLKDVASKFVEIERTSPIVTHPDGSPNGISEQSDAPTERVLLQVSASPEDIRGRYLSRFLHTGQGREQSGVGDAEDGAQEAQENTEYVLKLLLGLPPGMSHQARHTAMRAMLKVQAQEVGAGTLGETHAVLEKLLVDVATTRAHYAWDKEKNSVALEQEIADCQHLLREVNGHVQTLLTVRRELETQTDTRLRHLDTLVHLLSEEKK